MADTEAPEQGTDLVERGRKAYEAVAYFPEHRGDPMAVGGAGFMDLLALRNLVPELLQEITRLRLAARGEVVAEALWQAESVRATEKPRRITWAEESEKTREQWRFMAAAAMSAFASTITPVVRSGEAASEHPIPPPEGLARE